jgi:hypothetical protein
MTSDISSTTLNIHDRWTEMESVSHRPEENPLAAENPKQPEQTDPAIAPSSKKEYGLSGGQRLPGSDFFVSGSSQRFYEKTYYTQPSRTQPNGTERVRGEDRALPKIIHFQPLDAERWRLASAAMSNSAYNKLLPYTQDRRAFIVNRPDNLPEGWDPTEGFTWRECIAFAPVAAVYAGIHAIAWNYNFATVAKRFMWRLSVLYLSIVFGLLLINGLYSALREGLYKWRGEEPQSWRECEGWHSFVVCISILPAIFCVMLLYPFARGYLVIESFIGLRYLPTDAYLVAQWTQVIPHW